MTIPRMGVRARIENSAPEVLEIDVYDTIGEDFWTGEGVLAKDVHRAIRDSRATEIHLSVNSHGGDAFEGVAIHNILRQRAETKGTRITADVFGVAASAASVIVAAADEVRVPQNAAIMVHRAWTRVRGNADDLAETAKLLRQLDDSIAQTYAASASRRGAQLTTEQAFELMGVETWMFGAEAVERGFADAESEPLEAAASIDRAEVERVIRARVEGMNQPAVGGQENSMNKDEMDTIRAELADARAAHEKALAEAAAAVELAERAEAEAKANAEALESLRAEKALIDGVAAEQAAQLNRASVEALVGAKLYPAEVEAMVKLRASNKPLFDELIAARPELVLLSDVTGADKPANSLTTDPESKLAAAVREA